MSNYRGPNFLIPYSIPSNIPVALTPFIKPIYIMFQNMIQTLVRYGGIGPRNAGDILSSNADPTAVLANNTHRLYIQASEAIAEGAMVNLYSPGLGVLSARNANATNANKPCDGFCSQPSGILAGQVGEVILNDGMNTSLSGLTVGSRYFLDTTNGLVTTTAPVAAGNLEQSLGIAITATALRFWTGKQVQH